MPSFFQNISGSIIVALVVIVAQFFIQPAMQRKVTSQSELWLHKKDVYIKTIELVDKRFDSMEFKDAKPINEPPTSKEINSIYRQLLVFCDDDKILTDFEKIMNISVEGYCSPANRGKFIKLLRKDLGKSKLSIIDDKMPYFREHAKK